ncbi:carbohydrate esterase family 8 protein [Phanerochaete carnosa HHB-10118-sp]|uniref:Pectinesterase n=1 Tax=Phanerochaete carnosa (strain HHB-10118-sp) TaxID=650164 RepID=K5W1Y3_PHACS|nr:carbohydrate esterase family 8 protein [Phanerochaete carnosa HHB-10118-sp]EKM52889.1 carbohydrate esterase family 8 protein [Phanerochaete carnosa HHB-10118-sp]
MLLSLAAFIFGSVLPAAYAAARTSPPVGSVVVSQNATAGQFSTLSSAVASLPNDDSTQTIFIFPGTYKEQVLVDREGPVTIFGWTENTMDFNSNTVVLAHNASLATSSSDDTTGTLRIKTNNSRLYNLDIRNDFGVAETNGQAIALSQYGSQFGAYACRFFSYQDTLYANEGNQVYLKSYIEGAVDFIFGREGTAYFYGNTIATKGAGCVTASGRESNDTNLYLFESNTVVAASDAFSNITGKTFLGRPWGDFAKVVFKNTVITAPLDEAIWSVWQPTDPNTEDVFFAEFNSTGPGVADADRPSFATLLDSSQAAQYTIATTVGSDWATWVDTTYLS